MTKAFAMHKLLSALAATAVILGGASALFAQQGPRAEQDRHGPNRPIHEQGPADQSADQSRDMSPAAERNDKPSMRPVEPKKKDLHSTAPKGPADQSTPPPKN
jgi:hypothetical protein